MGRRFDGMMAVAAVHGQVTRMQGMTEGERLHGAVTDISIAGRAKKGEKTDRASAQEKHPGHHGDRDFVRPALEELGQ